MAFIVEYKSGKLMRCEMMYKRTTPSPLFFCERERFFCSGEVFGFSYEYLMHLQWQRNPEILNSLYAAVAVLQAENNHCDFAVDMNGLDTFYYYHVPGHFMVSDNIWDIVKIIQPGKDDINSQFIKYSLFEAGPPDGSTLIKNIHILMPSEVAHYDAVNDQMVTRKFYQFKYSGTCDDVDAAVDALDKTLHDAMQAIKDTCGDVRYGVGVSGGLDSRIISHYAKAHDMKLVGFNVCVPKPNGVLHARSIHNAMKIAEVFDIRYHNVKWSPKKLSEKLLFSVKCNPSFSGDSFKYESEGLPEFDVLLSGGSGFIVGSMLPKDIDLFSSEQIVDAIYQLFCSYSASSFSDRMQRGMSFVFGYKIGSQAKSHSWFAEKLMGSKYQDILRCDIRDFVKQKATMGLSNIDIYEDYFLNICGYTNRYGAFESLLGTKRAYSIYVPFALKETLTWSPALLYGRKVLNELIIKKVPEVAQIRSESYFMAPKDTLGGFFTKVLSIADFLVRGNGTAIDQHYMRRNAIEKLYICDINKNMDDWFHEIFHMNHEPISKRIVQSEPVRVLSRIWELKTMIDCLEHKSYMDFAGH